MASPTDAHDLVWSRRLGSIIVDLDDNSLKVGFRRVPNRPSASELGIVHSLPEQPKLRIVPALQWNFYLGPVQWNQDLAVSKYVDFTEKIKVRFTVDFFNVFNHPNDPRPNQTTGLQDLSQQTNDPRIIQLSLRLEW